MPHHKTFLMSQDAAKLSPSRASFVQARNAEKPSCPIEIPSDKSPAKVQHWACPTSTFGGRPPRSLYDPKSTHWSPNNATTWSASFSTWADQAHSFPFSDADLCASDDHEAYLIKTAPSPPKTTIASDASFDNWAKQSVTTVTACVATRKKSKETSF